MKWIRECKSARRLGKRGPKGKAWTVCPSSGQGGGYSGWQGYSPLGQLAAALTTFRPAEGGDRKEPSTLGSQWSDILTSCPSLETLQVAKKNRCPVLQGQNSLPHLCMPPLTPRTRRGGRKRRHINKSDLRNFANLDYTPGIER